jgi:MFS family permease
MAMHHTKQSTPLRSDAPHAPSPALMVRAKPVKPWLVLTAVLFGFFMALLDTTIVNIAIPSIQTGLSADLLSISWVLNAYNLMYAVLLITVGRFADQYGRKRLLLIAMILFSLGSLGCALGKFTEGLTNFVLKDGTFH